METFGELILKENLTSTTAKVVWLILGTIIILFFLWGFIDIFNCGQAIISGIFILYIIWAIVTVYPKWEVYYYSGSIKLKKGYLLNTISIETNNIMAMYIVEFNSKRDFRYFGKFGIGKFRHVIRWPQLGWPVLLDPKKGIFVETKRGMHYIIGSRDPEKVIDIIKSFSINEAKLSSVAQQLTLQEPYIFPFSLAGEQTGHEGGM